MDFPCTSCGAQLQWKPGADSMACPFCGTTCEAPAPEAEAEIREYRLDEAMRRAPRGYGAEVRSIVCDACGAGYSVEPTVESGACPFCGSGHVHDLEEENEGVIRPESVLPFVIERNEARRKFRAWLSALWFRPSSLKSAAQIESIAGIYLPAWTFDTEAESQWSAEAGYYYYEEETRTVTVDGQEVERTEKVRKTRWEHAMGTHERFYDDWLIQASGGLDQAAIKGLLPFSLDKLKPYDKAYLAGFQAERYAIGLEEGWGVAQQELRRAEESECRRLVPGDTQRELKVQTRFSEVHFKHTLLPIWVAAYRYEGQVYRYLVNGESGKAWGDAPYSKIKIILTILSVIGMILGCMGFFSIAGAIGAALGR